MNEALFAEVVGALQPHIDLYEQVEGSKKNSQDPLLRLKNLISNLDQKNVNP